MRPILPTRGDTNPVYHDEMPLLFPLTDDTEALLRAGGESVRRVAFVYNITDDHLVYERFTGK